MVGLYNDINETIDTFYDTSITYQPNHIANAHMERSAAEVYPMDITGDEIIANRQPCLEDDTIPCIIEPDDDSYESM
jgi:hypothetical protein